MPLQRYKLTLAYRGSRYHGWQAQAANEYYKGPSPAEGEGIPTVQEILRRATVAVVRHPINLVGSSRTDAGVHAKGQVAHFDTDQVQIPTLGMLRAINSRLPEDIVLRRIEPVGPDFDAIGSTLSKRYQYFIWNAEQRNPFLSELCWHRRHVLDIPAMRDAARLLAGTHDFASFARAGHGRENTIRTVHNCSVSRRGPLLVIGVEGSGFLWNMVRIIVGTLIQVGIGRYRPDDVSAMLAARNRESAGSTAPPQGLYLQWIRHENSSPPLTEC